MLQFQEIQIDGVYLTSDDTAAGTNYISEVTGLTPLKRPFYRIDSGQSINGTPKQQVRTHLGRPIEVLVPLIPTSKYDALIAAINETDDDDEDHAVVFTGDKGTFSLTCVIDDVDDSGAMQEAGHRDFKVTMRIKSVVSIT